jgi:hypothetical protein
MLNMAFYDQMQKSHNGIAILHSNQPKAYNLAWILKSFASGWAHYFFVLAII